MYDYLFQFTDQAEAATALTGKVGFDNGYYFMNEEGGGALEVEIIVQDPVYDNDGNETQARIVFPGYWFVVSTKDRDTSLFNIAQCVQETVRPETPRALSQCILQTRLDADSYASFQRVSPVFAGASYLWGQ